MLLSMPLLHAENSVQQESKIKETTRVEQIVALTKKNPKNTAAKAVVLLVLGLTYIYGPHVFNSFFASGESSLNVSADIAESSLKQIDRDTESFNMSGTALSLLLMAGAGVVLSKLWNFGIPKSEIKESDTKSQKPSLYNRLVKVAKQNPYKVATLIGAPLFALYKYQSMGIDYGRHLNDGFIGWPKQIPLLLGSLFELPVLLSEGKVTPEAGAFLTGSASSIATATSAALLLNEIRKSFNDQDVKQTA